MLGGGSGVGHGGEIGSRPARAGLTWKLRARGERVSRVRRAFA
jgi:hypothetical protein